MRAVRGRQRAMPMVLPLVAAYANSVSSDLEHTEFRTSKPRDAAAACDDWTGLEGAETGAVPCGLLYYTHIGKTGGDSIKHHLRRRATTEKWQFFDLYMKMSPPSLHLPYRWELTRAMHALLVALNSSRPRVIVHQHSGFGGAGEYAIDRWFRPLACRFRQQASESDCRVVLAATLREPTARACSHAIWSGMTEPGKFEGFMRDISNFQTKYMLFSHDWRVSVLRNANASFDATLLQPALASLSVYDLVGRTEELQRFQMSIDSRMGWRQTDAATAQVAVLHNSSSRAIATEAMLSVARRFNTIDAQLYGNFCRPRDGVSSRGPRRVQPLCEDNASPYPFPRYWTAEHAKCNMQSAKSCRWTLLPVHDGRACRAGWAHAREPMVVCEDHRGTPQAILPIATLPPYRRAGAPAR